MPRRLLRTRQQSVAYLPPALVLECSVAVAWYIEAESTDFTDSLLHAIPQLEIWVPALWMLEFSNALFAAERRRRISPSERAQIVGQARLHSLNVDPQVMSLRQADELSGHNTTSLHTTPPIAQGNTQRSRAPPRHARSSSAASKRSMPVRQ
jgi:predicted nucleic acid-binding protein